MVSDTVRPFAAPERAEAVEYWLAERDRRFASRLSRWSLGAYVVLGAAWISLPMHEGPAGWFGLAGLVAGATGATVGVLVGRAMLTRARDRRATAAWYAAEQGINLDRSKRDWFTREELDAAEAFRRGHGYGR